MLYERRQIITFQVSILHYDRYHHSLHQCCTVKVYTTMQNTWKWSPKWTAKKHFLLWGRVHLAEKYLCFYKQWKFTWSVIVFNLSLAKHLFLVWLEVRVDPEVAQLDMPHNIHLLWTFIVHQLVSNVGAVDYHLSKSLVRKNCSSLLHIPIPNSSSETDLMKCDNCSNDCPPWYQPSGHGICQFGNDLGFIVKQVAHLMQSELEQFYCMTTP